MSKRIVIVGGVAAGMSAASLIKREKKDWEAVVFEKGPHISYASCGTPYFIGGSIQDDNRLIALKPSDAIEKRNIDLRLGQEALAIDPANRRIAVRSDGGERWEAYDELLLATGARPIRLPFIDTAQPGVFELRTLADAQKIKRYLESHQPQTATILGGGYVGLEMAEAFRALGLETTILEKSPSILQGMSPYVIEKAEAELSARGVRLMAGVGAVGLERRADGTLEGVATDTAGLVAADLVISAVGVVPNSELAAEAGLALGPRKSVEVDRRMRTSVEGVYSAGDGTATYHRLLGRNAWIPLGQTANRQGRVAGSNLVGRPEEYPGTLGTSVFKLFDLAVARTGLSESEAREEGMEIAITEFEGASRAHYYPDSQPIRIALVAEKRTGRLLGAQMIGQEGVAQRINAFAVALWNSMSVGEIESLDLAYAPPFAPVWDPILMSARLSDKATRG